MPGIDVKQDQEAYPLVTIGLPVFNGGKTIERSLQSLIEQDYPNIQLIISDNASTDNTLEICERFASKVPRITLIKKQENEGPLANFKTVLSAAEGEFFMWAAADDYWHENFITRLLPELKANPAVGCAMCAVQVVDPEGKKINKFRFAGKLDPKNMTPFELSLKIVSGYKYNLFIYGLFRKDILRNCMDSFTDVLGGDRQFIAGLSLATKFMYLDEILLERTYQHVNAEKYTEEFLSFATPFLQVFSFIKILITSKSIPIRRKLAIPILVSMYTLFLLHQYCNSAMDKLLFVRVKVMAAKVISKRGLMIAGALTVSLSVLLVYFEVLPIDLVLVGIGAIGLFFIQLLFIKRWFILNRRWFIANQSSLIAKFSSGSFPGVGGHASDTLFLAARELRFLTDSFIHAGIVAGDSNGNRSIPKYAIQQLHRQKAMLDFTRNMEDSKIREVYLTELFMGIEKTSVPIGVINEMSGHPNKADMLYVASVAKHSGAKNIFEFGTYMGRTTFAFAHNNPEAQVTTLNLPISDDPSYAPYIGALLKGTEEEKRVSKIEIDSQKFDTSPYQKQFDFIFVDAGHTYDLVKNDTEKAFELLKPGGIIMWHDYAPKSVGLVEYFKEFTQKCPLFRIRSTCLLVYIDGIDVMNHDLVKIPETLESKYRKDNPLIPESIYHLQ